jgi:hypothetical protein
MNFIRQRNGILIMNQIIGQFLKTAFARFYGVYTRRSAPLKALMLFVIILFAGIFIAGFIPIDLPFVPAQISSTAEKALGGSCTVGKVTVALWSGFRVRDIVIKMPPDREMALEAEVPEIRVGFRILPLIFKHLRLHECVVYKPVVKVRLNPKKAPVSSTAPRQHTASSGSRPGFSLSLPGPLSGFSFSLGAARVESGAFTLVSGGALTAEAADLDVAASLSSLASGSGKISIGRIRVLDSWKVAGLLLKFSLRGDKLNIDKLDASMYGGRISGEGVYDLKSAKADTFDLNVRHLEIGPFYEDMKNRQGRFKGQADMTVHLGPCAPSPESLQGNGTLRVRDFSAEQIPLQKAAGFKILAPLFSQLMLNKLDVDFSMKKGRIFTARVDGSGKLYDLHASGWVGFDAALNEDVKVTLTEVMVPQLANLIEYAFIRGPDGRYVMLFKVSGTLNDPVITLDKKIVQNTVNKVLFQVGKSLGRYLKRK